jgi:integrase
MPHDATHLSMVTPGPTLQNVLDKLSALDIPAGLRAALRSAVLTTARVLRTQPDRIPAATQILIRRLRELHPSEVGMTDKRLANLKSELKRALAVTGMAVPPGKSALTPEWRELAALFTTKYQQLSLMRLMSYCSAQEISPLEVDDDVIEAFRTYLEESVVHRRPAHYLRDACQNWNKLADALPDWPQTRLTTPVLKKAWALPWSAFDPQFIADVQAWLGSLSDDDLFSEFGPAKPVRPATIAARDIQVRMFASAAALGGVPIETITSLATLVDVPTFRVAMKYLWGDGAVRKAKTVAESFKCMRYIARHWVKVSAAQQADLDLLVHRFSRRFVLPANGLTPKNDERLRAIDNPERLADLLVFPQTKFAQARKAPADSRMAALAAQIGLAVELLLMCPIRLHNLAGLRIDRHLQRTYSRGHATAHIVIPGPEVKNGQDFVAELPENTVRMLDEYLADFHPRLASGSPFIFPGNDGGAKAENTLSGQINTAIKKVTGLVFNPHLFRHLAGKLILGNDPKAHESARQVLGHRSLNTTVTHYLGEQRQAHLRTYDGLVDDLRAQATTSRRSRKPVKRPPLLPTGV